MRSRCLLTYLLLMMPAVVSANVVAANSAATNNVAANIISHRGPGLSNPEKMTMWDMSAVEQLDDNVRKDAPRYRHTVLSMTPPVVAISEIVDGRRMIYRADSIGMRWIGEETPLMRVRTDSLCLTNVLDSKRLTNIESGTYRFTAQGKYCGRAHIMEQGEYSSLLPVYGVIVSGSDTINVVMTTEKRHYTADIMSEVPIQPLDASRDSLEVYTIVRYRWYATSGETDIPIAVQTDMSSFDGVDYTPIAFSSVLYSVSPAEFHRMADMEDNRDIKETIAGAKVEYRDGVLYVTLTAHTSFDAIIGISDLGGIPYHNETVHIDEAEQKIILSDLPALRPGQYIVGIKSVKHPDFTKKSYIFVP